MKKLVTAASLVSCLILAGPVFGADAAAGKAKAASCASCHGPEGKSSNPMYPNLAGQQKLYLEKAMKAYKDGSRNDAMMKTLMTPMSDEDIANIAAWYSSL